MFLKYFLTLCGECTVMHEWLRGIGAAGVTPACILCCDVCV
jgi:hypothetical protein